MYKSRKVSIFKTTVLVTILSFQSLYPIRVLAAEDQVNPNPTPPTAEPSVPPAVTELPATAITTPESAPTPTAPSTSSGPAVTPPPTPTAPGPQKPSGAAANTYYFNEATGLWENDHYKWDPISKKTTPKDSPSYSYNPATGMWDTTQWQYNATSGKYEPNTMSVQKLPENAIATTSSSQPSILDTSNSAQNSESVKSSNGETDNSNNVVDKSAKKGFFDFFNNASISNNLFSSARSGNASVVMNTIAGNAITGMATVMSNVVNLLQSSWGAVAMNNLKTFVSDIFGDVIGDFLIDPGMLQGDSSTLSRSPADSNLEIKQQNNGTINNNLSLTAVSGNAAVANNTTGGNAQTGSANAVANIVNMINSIIGANESFLGVINVHGNLDGDILLPPNFLAQLLQSNLPRHTLDVSQVKDGELVVDLTENQSIVNDSTLQATSGQATVSNNTSAGNAQTGNASTNITVLNLTGRQIVGNNALLVFVNVLGEWVGLIVDSPTGSTSAMLGDGITQNVSTSSNMRLASTNNSTINNNLNLSANSGDASVENNTQAGNAQTGNATASANLLNIVNSQISLSHWLGIVFINVFGAWHGSFGINTSAGNVLAPTQLVRDTGIPSQVFRFAASDAGSTTKLVPVAYNISTSSDIQSNQSSTQPMVASADSNTGNVASETESANTATKPRTGRDLPMISILGSLMGATLLGTERVMSRRRKNLV